MLTKTPQNNYTFRLKNLDGDDSWFGYNDTVLKVKKITVSLTTFDEITFWLATVAFLRA